MPLDQYLEKHNVLWWGGAIPGYGFRILGPYCIKKRCRVELVPAIGIIHDSLMKCPSCGEEYSIKHNQIEDVRKLILKEYLALDRKGDLIKPIKLDKQEKDELTVSSTDKFITVRVESEDGLLQNAHIYIGDKENKLKMKAHLVISGQTGEIRVDSKDESPRRHIKSLKSELFEQKDKKSIKSLYKP